MSNQKKFLPKLYPVEQNINRTWYIEYTGKDGLRKKVYGRLNKLPTLQDRITEAETLIKAIIAQDLPRTGKQPANQLISDISEVIELKKVNWSSKTIAAYETHFFSFAQWYREQGCPAMDVRQALRFLNTISAKNKATTRNNYRNNLKTLFALLCKFFKKRYDENPFADAGRVPEVRKTREWFRPHQVEELLERIRIHGDDELMLAVKIMFHCFVRPNEMRFLKAKNIIIETKRLQVESYFAKN